MISRPQRKCRARWRACLLAATLIASSCAASPAGAAERIAAGPPAQIAPNFAFGRQADIRNPETRARLAGQLADARQRYPDAGTAITTIDEATRTRLTAATADALAHFATTSLATTADLIMQARFLDGLIADDRPLAVLRRRATVPVTDLAGRTYMLPLPAAALVEMHLLALTDTAPRSRPAAPNIAGVYDVVAADRGACPALPTRLTLRQSDFVIESRAGNALVAYGAVGAHRVYLAFNAQRYATIDRSTTRSTIAVPDTPPVLLAASIGAPGAPLTFTSANAPSCTVTLTPLS